MGRIVEISSNHRYLHADRGFLVVEDSVVREEIGRVPISDIAGVIAHGYQISYSNELLVRLAELEAPLVLSNARHHPVGVLISLDGNGDQARRFDAQIAASLPTKKRMWTQVVKAKVRQQAMVLEFLGYKSQRLLSLADKVKSGDPDNIEGQAAKIYFQRLFGADFRRDRTLEGTNAMLNYGYTILRATTARAVVAAGLHPTLGIHHSNQGNSFRLVDDLMEPFRPFVDHQVHHLAVSGGTELNKEVKLALVEVMSHDLMTDSGLSPISSCLHSLAVSTAQVFLGEGARLRIPQPQISIDLQELD